MFEVVSKSVWYVTKNGQTKYKYELTDGVSAFSWDALSHPLVFDSDNLEFLERQKWYINRSGLAQKNDALMHNIVYKRNGGSNTAPDARTVHLNGFKLDNRFINLQSVGRGDLSNDRNIRIDKKSPPQELIDVGIHQLPRFVRWDKSEKKFIIQNHPCLQGDVNSGLRAKAVLSGSKSSKLDIVKKYQDILSKLDDLNRKCPSFADAQQRRAEYLEICDAIQRYDGPCKPQNVKSESGRALIST